MLAALVLASLGQAPQFEPPLFDPRTGAVTLMRGRLSAPLTGDLPSAARTWALTKRGELGLPPGSTLTPRESFGTRFGASFHLQQELSGVEVYGGKVVVTIDASARVMLASSSVMSYRAARTGWAIGPGEALQRAARTVPLPALQADGSPYGGARRVYLPVLDEVHAGYVVHVPTVDVRANWYVGIDAVTGEVLWKQDRVYHAPLDANVYPSSPGGLDAGVGVTPTARVTLTHDDGGSMVSADGGGGLVGTQLDAYNCCVAEGCDAGAPDAGPKRSIGMTMLPNPFQPGQTLVVHYDLAVCDFRHRATNNAAEHASASFEYPPQDPPLMGPVSINDPASSDEFAEVNSFYNVNREYDWIRGLSRAAKTLFPGQPIQDFQMRDERLGRKPAIWTNVVFPDFTQILANPACVLQGTTCVINGFTRVDNAAFLAKENFDQIPLPEYRNDVDTLMIFQGDKADFAYDAPVLWHEFGHGTVYSTANLAFGNLTIDNRSANDEQGALHEGLADYFAGAFGNDPDMGRYVGPRVGGGGGMTGIRVEPFIRSLDNTLSCPGVLHGEVHDDSQHVAGALWRLRQDVFQGTDQGKTFDAVFYAMLVSLAPTADFAAVAAATKAHVVTAFPTVVNPDSKAQMIFDMRGVTNCSKVVDVTGAPPRSLYGIGTRPPQLAAGSIIPGPVQLKLKTPNGAVSVKVSASVGGGGFGGLGGGAPPELHLMARAGSPITFTRQSTMLANDAHKTVDMPMAMGATEGTADVMAPCGATSEVYVSVGNSGAGGATLQNVTVTVTPPASCTPDAGFDAGMTVILPGIAPDGGDESVFLGPPVSGCGCGAGAGAPIVLALLALLRRRRR